MEFNKNMKKKLDFSRPTFLEPELKIPCNDQKKLDFSHPTFAEPLLKIHCRDLSNRNRESEEERLRYEQTLFADDESSSRDSAASSVVPVVIEKVSVFLRLKPTKEPITELYNFDKNNVIIKANPFGSVERQYTFTEVLSQSTDQSTVFESCVRQVLASPFSSVGAVFASYGVSNSGKTYTILGDKSAGIVPRALTQIFTEYQNYIATFPYIKVQNEKILILNDDQVEAEVDALKDFLKESRKLYKGKQANGWMDAIKEEHNFVPNQLEGEIHQIHVWVSFVEIYSEKVIDLLKIPKKANEPTLRIISNNHNSYVLGLTWLHVSNIEDALELLQCGLRRVNYAVTGLNAHSSRSHTIFTINLISERGSTYEFSSYKFCDLAGAERISKTGNAGDRLKEAGGINTSLLVLGRCLEAVMHNQKPGVKKEIVPVREAKLTFLIQSSLMGKEKFVMIVNLLPTSECFEENTNVLHFGSIANKIVTKKTKAKRFSRASSRYSYFMQHAVNSPKMNSSVFESDFDDSSSINISYQISSMTTDQLYQVIYKKDMECQVLRNIIEQKEREFLDKENELRKHAGKAQQKAYEIESLHFQEQLSIRENYYQKKLKSMEMKYERQLNTQYEHIQSLLHENTILKRNLGNNDDGDIIDLDDEYSDEEEEEEVINEVVHAGEVAIVIDVTTDVKTEV